ncbi:MAG TPA: HD domain-containing protein [Nitrososphaeraceae archaeon]|nr:HD domain-containing protein [Nitrososphaeraceae archaeon]
MRFGPDIKDNCNNNNNNNSSYAKGKVNGKSFSLYYNDLARWLFITLAFSGLLSTGLFGIPLAPKYLADNEIDIRASLFTLFSALGTIWGVMGYREFTRSANLVKEARDLARKLDPVIGNYEYSSYNPETKEYENGYAPLGPVDFWDKETQVPRWLDKGKYWHILLGFQTGNKEIMLQVVQDQDLPFTSGIENVALTSKEPLTGISSGRKSRKRYIYRVKIPQWIVMNTDRLRFAKRKEEWNIDDLGLSSIIADLNKKLVLAANEIIEREKPRIQYPWKTTAFGIYLNKSLPLRIVYKEVIRQFPGAKKRIIEDTNTNLANIEENKLIAAIIEVAIQKGIPTNRIDNINSLLSFLKNTYTKQGLGEGSSEYHNFHHSLEVAYMSLQLLPKEFHGHSFTSKDYEVILIAGLLHDYDPAQTIYSKVEVNNGTRQPKGPKVAGTINEIYKTRILDAYFTMNGIEFENYFREYKSALLPPVEFDTTHPEYVKVDTNQRPTESIIVEALIWRTDFPYSKQKISQEKFTQLMNLLGKQRQDTDKIKLLSEILWIADLAVTYMGSDPIRAWDRVTNLYDELDLPKVEAVSRTDAFFSDFAETDLFQELINMRQFPAIFRQRWNMVYQFFHEGNPSTQLNRIISKTRNLYLKVNLEIGMRTGEMLQQIAANNWAEYFIGIGTDQIEVLRAKSKFADLDPPNASAFWGDIRKLLPHILDKSIDNFLIVLPQNFFTMQEKLSLRSLFAFLSAKLTAGGTLQLLTDLEINNVMFNELIAIIMDAGFQIALGNVGKTYFPKDWKDTNFIEGQIPQVLVFHPKKQTKA